LARLRKSHLWVTVAIVAAFGLGALLPGAFGSSEAPTAVRTALAQSQNVQGARNRKMVLSKVVVQPSSTAATPNRRRSASAASAPAKPPRSIPASG
jgi:hypothetical protein